MTLDDRQARIRELNDKLINCRHTDFKKWKDNADTIRDEIRELEAPMKGTYGVDLIAKERQSQIAKGFDWKHDIEKEKKEGAESNFGFSRFECMVRGRLSKPFEETFTIKEWIELGALIAAEIDRLTLEGME